MQIRTIQLRSRPPRSRGATWRALWLVLSGGPDRPPRAPSQTAARADAVREALLDEYLRGPGRRRF